jgi:hypothetical protein
MTMERPMVRGELHYGRMAVRLLAAACALLALALPSAALAQVRKTATLSDPQSTSFDNFGSSVAVSGSTMVVGARHYAGSGVAYAYVNSAGQWKLQATLQDPNPADGDDFGGSVVISGNTVVISSNDNVYVFERSGVTWTLQSTLNVPAGCSTVGSDVPAPDGQALAISGSTLVVGGVCEPSSGPNEDEGAAYVYRESGGQWTLTTVLNDPHGTAGDSFGSSVAISGNTLMVGAYEYPANRGEGAMYMYEQSNGHWDFRTVFKDPHAADEDWFGSAVAISGTVLVVSAEEYPGGDGEGRTYVWDESGGHWRFRAVLKDPHAHTIDSFGSSLAISGTALVIGADGYPDGFPGAAYLYTLASGREEFRTVIKDPQDRDYDYFGSSVALSGSTLAIGAYDTQNSGYPGGSGPGDGATYPAQADGKGNAYVYTGA